MALPKAKTVGVGMNMQNYTQFIGKKVRLKQTVGALPIGSLVRLTNAWSGNSGNAYFMFEGYENLWPSGLNLNYTALEPVDVFSKEYLAEEKARLEKKQKEIKDSLEDIVSQQHYLMETNQDSASEKEMQVFQTLKVMEKDMTPLEKAKMLAKLLG